MHAQAFPIRADALSGRFQPARAHGGAPILIGGRDAARRERLASELAGSMPQVAFEHVCEAGELLERAADCRLVVLADDFEGESAAAVARMLSRRHPELPVVTVGPPAPVRRRRPPRNEGAGAHPALVLAPRA